MGKYTEALAIIDRLLDNQENRIERREIETGYSYWLSDVTRVFKIKDTKTKVYLEINVPLPDEFLTKYPSIENFSPKEARDKHYGTMKYRYKHHDTSELETIMEQVLKSCKEKS